ncbi:MAG TPA: hypothetical protein VK090_00455, partial [Paracoccaceae bacterium]|nr:hypothetical protein [Paracoccaceae bacterium]
MRAGGGRAASLSFGELAPPLPHLLDAPDHLANRAALIHAIDQLAAEIKDREALRKAGLDLIAAHLATGREKLRNLFLLRPAAGLRAARSHAHLIDVAIT